MKMVTTDAAGVRQRHGDSNRASDSWTLTFRIAIPKPRHWLAGITCLGVLFVVYFSGTLLLGSNDAPDDILSAPLADSENDAETLPSPSAYDTQLVSLDPDVPFIRGTFIRGGTAVSRFHAYLQCFSESGYWKYDPTPRPLPWNDVGEHYLSVCDERHWGMHGDQADLVASNEDLGPWRVREELKWVWQTNDTCPLLPVNRDDLCRRIGPKRNVMVVGDAVNQALSFSLMNHLITNGTGYEKFSGNTRSTDGIYEMCGDIFGTGNGFKVSFVRNDRLSLVDSPVGEDEYAFIEHPWIDLVEKHDAQILLLNRGVHYENDTIYEAALREAFASLKARYPALQVIYRNTPPGHFNCTTAVNVPPLRERQEFGWDGEKYPDHFSWGAFQRQNALAKQIVEEFQYVYLDVDTMLSLRADGHPAETDCLRYCAPGPLDVAVQLLYNILPFLYPIHGCRCQGPGSDAPQSGPQQHFQLCSQYCELMKPPQSR